MSRVHLDHNATSPMRDEVRELLQRTTAELGGNPSSLHAAGRRARHLLDEARERTAAALGVAEDEVVFTSGGTESNNLAVLGFLRASRRGPEPGPLGPLGPLGALVTSTVEHSSVLGPAEQAEREGHRWLRLGVDAQGLVQPRALLELVSGGLTAPDAGPTPPGGAPVALVSIQAAGNEVGQAMPLASIAAALATLGETRPRLHTDAVQALGRLPLDLAGWGVDLASFSAHKVGGPVGVGVLFRRLGVPLEPLFHGGAQEEGLRPGTENVAGIAAAALAIELAVAEREAYARRADELARELWEGIQAAHPDAVLLGPSPGPSTNDQRLPGTLNVVLPGVDGKVLVTRLDLAGLEASAGSACASGSLEPSHVLLAMGLPAERARAGLRLSVGRNTTRDDIRTAVDILGTVR